MRRRSFLLAAAAIGCSDMAQRPAGTRPWYASTQRLSAMYADQGTANLVSGSPQGAWVATGGAVDLNAAAGPNGLPGFRFNASSGGYLQATNLSPQTQMPFHLLICARVRTPLDTGTIICRPSTNFAVSMSGTTRFRMTEAGPGLQSAIVDPTQWQLLDVYWGGTEESAISVNQAGRVVGNPGGAAAWAGFALGGGSSGGARLDVDVYGFELWQGRVPQATLAQYCLWLTQRTGIAIAAPPAYTPPNPFWPPQLAARPALWPAGSTRTIFFGSWGQSNDVGYAASPIVAPSSAVKMLNLAWQVKQAANPLQEQPAGLKNPVPADGLQISGYQNRACNTIAATLGRTVTISVDSRGGSSSTLWMPNASGDNVPASLFNAAVAKMQEAQYWGQDLGGVFVCQGEADSSGATWLSNWQTSIAKARAILSAPRLPFFFTQTPSSAGVRTSESAISDPPNNVFFLPTVLNANMADINHWNATGYDLAGQALATQVLAGWPYQ